MKRIPWLSIGAVVLLVGAYVMFFVKVSPDRSLAEPYVLEIVWSNPADGFIDVRQIEDANNNPDGITQISVRFSESVTLTADRIKVVTTGATAPLVESVTQNGDDWIIDLDRPMPAAESTAIVFDAGATWVLIHSHPGDVNLDGSTDWNDATTLNIAIETPPGDITGYDINRDGQLSSADVGSLASVIAVYDGRDWSVEPLGHVLCCCCFDSCGVYVGSSCPSDNTETDCPCVPNPCEGVGGE